MWHGVKGFRYNASPDYGQFPVLRDSLETLLMANVALVLSQL